VERLANLLLALRAADNSGSSVMLHHESAFWRRCLA